MGTSGPLWGIFTYFADNSRVPELVQNCVTLVLPDLSSTGDDLQAQSQIFLTKMHLLSYLLWIQPCQDSHQCVPKGHFSNSFVTAVTRNFISSLTVWTSRSDNFFLTLNTESSFSATNPMLISGASLWFARSLKSSEKGLLQSSPF